MSSFEQKRYFEVFGRIARLAHEEKPPASSPSPPHTCGGEGRGEEVSLLLIRPFMNQPRATPPPRDWVFVFQQTNRHCIIKVRSNLCTAYENIGHLRLTAGSEIRGARRQTLRATLVSIHVCFAHRCHRGLMGCRPGVRNGMASDFHWLCFWRTHCSCRVAPDSDAFGAFGSHRAIRNPGKGSMRNFTSPNCSPLTNWRRAALDMRQHQN